MFNDQPFDSKSPYLVRIPTESVFAAPDQLFTFNVQLSTNIAYKGSMKNFKKVTLRKLILLKSKNIIYCLPLEIVVVYVKQLEFKD